MSPRNTNTGGVLETMILPALARGGYSVEKQVHVGVRLGKKGKHKVDAIATKGNLKILVSSKWQQVSGTAEEKVPYEIMCLAEAIKDNPAYKKAYVILGGDGWSLREFYISDRLGKFMQNVALVKVVSLERFIAMANKAEL